MPHLARLTSPSVAAHIAELNAVIAAQRGWIAGALQVSAALDEIARQQQARGQRPEKPAGAAT